ncbi:MAG: hypothetical protein GAK45_01907 [Pseudomonas citronellolis]|nr:MAG: hypothetical protein GAK45_01907 [Pseudomonas citronellolis]
MQVIGRLDGSAGASEAWYYLTSAPGNYALAFPLAVPALLLLWHGADDSARRLMRACLLAALVIGVGLSVPQAKKARYVLPMAPFLAALATYPFYAVGSRLAGVLRGLMQGLWALLPGLLAVGVLLAWRRQPDLAMLRGELLACLMLLLVLQGLVLIAAWRARWRAGALAGCAVLALWTAYIGVFEAAERQLYDTRQFSQAADAVIAAQPAPVAFVGLGRDAKAIKYLVNLDHDVQPSFIDGSGLLPPLQGPLYLVMSAARLRSLAGTPIAALTPLLKASFDHEPYVLLYLPASGAAP